MDAGEVWGRLLTGRSLEDLGLPVVNGRTDLRGIAAPEPSVVRQYVTAMGNVSELGNLLVVRGCCWKKLDFSKGQLKSLRFYDCRIEDCSFDGANCSDWRMWGTSISNSTFRGADLRKAALGGVENGKRNSIRYVDFTKADLRQTVYVSAEMVGCRFSHTKLAKVDFQGTVFVDCLFEGKLDEVQFHRHAFRGEVFPPNEMKRVDLSGAKLRNVEFRGLDMESVKWPEDEEHFVVEDYAATLDRLLAVWSARSDVGAKRLAASFGIVRRWVGPRQRVGVVSKADLMAAGGEEAVADFLRVIGR